MVPLHQVHDPSKVTALAESIKQCGWQGMPLVVWRVYGDLLTGTHRYAAAQSLGWPDSEIPTVDIEDIFTEDGLSFVQTLAEYNDPYVTDENFLYVIDELSSTIKEKYGIDMH